MLQNCEWIILLCKIIYWLLIYLMTSFQLSAKIAFKSNAVNDKTKEVKGSGIGLF